MAFSPPAIMGMSMMGGFEFQMLSQGDYTAQDLENGQINWLQPQTKTQVCQV